MPAVKSPPTDSKTARVRARAGSFDKRLPRYLSQVRSIISNFATVEDWVLDHFRRNPELAKLDHDSRNKVIDSAISDWVQSMARVLALEIRLAAQCGEESQFWPPKKTA